MSSDFDFSLRYIDYGDASSILKQTDIVLITVNKAERQSLLRFILPIPESDEIISVTHNKATYRIGRLGHYLVAHVESDMGSIGRRGSVFTTASAIDSINPKIIIMVGVAFGIDKKKQKIGDVLLSKRVVNYEPSRISDGEKNTNSRDSPAECGFLLHGIFSNALDWNHYVTQRRKANILSGDLLSGEKLIDNVEFLKDLKLQFPKSIGGEMEGAGVSSACKNREFNEWIILKGICDWADGTKNKKSQPRAAKAAMSLVFHVLSKENVFNAVGIYSVPKEIVESENEKFCLDATRGSALWTLNRLRSSVLPMLVKDLKAYEESGYRNEVCEAVRRDLNNFNNEIITLPESYNGNNKLRNCFQEFIEFYVQWNDVTGESEESKMNRIKCRNNIKKRRDAISEIIRLSQKSLAYNIEEINTIKMFEIQTELVNQYPDMFPNMKKAVTKISKVLNLEVN